MPIFPSAYVSNLKTNLVSYWNLDGNSVDYYGNNSGTDVNIGYTSAKSNSGATFNGSTSRIAIAGNGMGITTFTAAAWVYPTATRYQTVIANWNQTGYGGWDLRLTSGNKLELLFGTGTGILGTTSVSIGTVPLNTWTHVAVTVNSGNVIKLYINGSLDNTINSVNSLNYNATQRPSIGTNLYQGSTMYEWFIGRMDEIGFWNRILADSEILQLYNFAVTQISFNGSVTSSASAVASQMTNYTLLGSGAPETAAATEIGRAHV